MSEETRGARRRLVGRVTSDKMQKTIVVEVMRQVIDPLYGKVIRRRARFKAHDEKNDAKIGDRVEVEESRPLSRDKRWRLVQVLERAAATLRDELFQYRFQNHSNRLDNTSQLRKTRRDLARVLTVLGQKKAETAR